MVGVGRGEGTRRHAIGEASFGECLADEDSDVAHDASDDVFRQ